MKKKLLSALLAGAMLLSLVACGGTTGDDKPGSSSTESTVPPEQKTTYMEFPAEYQSWDENGKAVNFERLGTAENGMVVSLRYEASKIGTQIMEKAEMPLIRPLQRPWR